MHVCQERLDTIMERNSPDQSLDQMPISRNAMLRMMRQHIEQQGMDPDSDEDEDNNGEDEGEQRGQPRCRMQ